ncbi:MAG: NAD(P)/FAD-dependent oxidoreductase [Actinomycetia bacterium]|nr:NAD(P)/FAD-dependent oxidoreductase [Actinomycetes bacterium]
MDTEEWDAVVVGSGPGGLTTAACLGATGKRVLVLERHDVAGGNTQVFRRHHGDDWYEFDVGVHYIGECGPGGLFSNVFRSLGVGDRMSFSELDRDGFDTLHFPDFVFRVPASWDEYEVRLIEQFPQDRAGIERTLQVLRTVAEQSRLLFGEERELFDHWAFRPLSELFAEAELSPEPIAVLDHWSGLYAGGPSQTAVIMHARIISHYMGGAYYPEGGGQTIPARLIQVIEATGGEVRTLSPVNRIIVENGTATGVELETGDIVTAPIVVGNGDYRRMVTDLVGAQHLAPATIAWAQEAIMALGLVCTYVVVDKELPGPNTNYFLFPDYRTDEAYAELDAGQMPQENIPFAYVAMASRKDPDNPELCPDGHTNFQIMTLSPRGYGYWGVDTGPADGGTYRRNETYRARKQEITDRLIDAAERVLGPFRDSIVHVETATTLSHERYTHSSEGTSYGYMHSPEQSGLNRPQFRTEIDGLWIVGANSAGGHGIAGAMSGGVLCAGDIVDRPLIAEIFLGEQLVDPSVIPPDPEPFDPLEYCRGERLRNKRSAVAASQRERRNQGA